MNKQIRDNQNYGSYNLLGVLAGILFGSLAGAGAMLLMAPQSGKRTRMQIVQRGNELVDQTTDLVEKVSARVWLEEKKLSRNGKRKLNELIHRSQVQAAEQLKRGSENFSAWNKANLKI